MIEMYKAEQLMLCISERVFVHVVRMEQGL